MVSYGTDVYGAHCEHARSALSEAHLKSHTRDLCTEGEKEHLSKFSYAVILASVMSDILTILL